jgi:hypothetical protein
MWHSPDFHADGGHFVKKQPPCSFMNQASHIFFSAFTLRQAAQQAAGDPCAAAQLLSAFEPSG